MYTLSMKKWFHRRQEPKTQAMRARLSHIVHDERFWPVVVAVAVLLVLVIFGILAGIYGEPQSEMTPRSPFPPYNSLRLKCCRTGCIKI